MKKRARQRSEQLWRLVTRATMSSTPRHWFSHVAVVRIGEGAGQLALVVAEEFASQWTEDIESHRMAMSSSSVLPADAGRRLTFTPLHHCSDGQLSFLVIEAEQAVEVSMRNTPLLSAVHSALRSGPASIAELDEAVRREASVEEHDVLPGFLRHLQQLGVLQVCGTPRSGVAGWGPAAAVLSHQSRANETIDGWVDVYRRTTTEFPLDVCLHLQRLVGEAMRVLELIGIDANLPQQAKDEGTDTRPLLEMISERVATGDIARPAWHRPLDWVPPTSESSGYGQLHSHIAKRLDTGDAIDIDAELLDHVGAAPACMDWPIDCLLRVPSPHAPYAGVLDQMWPAGTVDSRFVDALNRLTGPVPQVVAYREFLENLEQRTGMLMVELLIPPLSGRAANAVRRPAYTRAWTGDADLAIYRPAGAPPPRYIPLEAISVRRDPTGLTALVDGQPIWPFYHATRSPLPPWDHVAALLLAASPQRLSWMSRRLRHSLNLFPGRMRMPRLTVAGDLILTPAQWRIGLADSWDSSLPVVAKVRALLRLRDQFGLPRWVVVTAPDGKTVPCDLESLRAIRLLDRTCRDARHDVIVTEMLPDPDNLLVDDRAHDDGDRLVSDLLLRLPCDQMPHAMADRLAHKLGWLAVSHTPGRSPTHQPAPIS